MLLPILLIAASCAGPIETRIDSAGVSDLTPTTIMLDETNKVENREARELAVGDHSVERLDEYAQSLGHLGATDARLKSAICWDFLHFAQAAVICPVWTTDDARTSDQGASRISKNVREFS